MSLIKALKGEDETIRAGAAVLVDLHGNCHAIGVILDGLASDKSTSARGSRYNSGVRYAYQQADRVVLVKFADGMVNVLPEPA